MYMLATITGKNKYRVNNQYSDKPIFRQLLLLSGINYELLVYIKIYIIFMSAAIVDSMSLCKASENS